jgi:hypothetical protein
MMSTRRSSGALPESFPDDASFRAGQRAAKSAPKTAERQFDVTWEDDYRWGSVDKEVLSLSAAINAALGGVVGGVLGGAAWMAAVVVTGLSLPYLAVLVGLLAGLGARFALEQTRPWTLGIFGALGAALAYVLTQYGLLDYALAQAMAQQGQFTGWFPLSPLHFPQVYLDYVIGVSDDVTSVLGQPGSHSLEIGFVMVCMAACWIMLLRRKN